MNLYSMEHHAKDTHQKLRQEARSHRIARQAATGQKWHSRSNFNGKVAAAVIALAMVALSVVALITQ